MIKNKILFFLICLPLSAAQAQKAFEIMELHHQSHRQEFWDQVQTVSFEGVWFQDTRKRSFLLEAKKPGKVLVKGTINGEDYVECVNGTSNWAVDPLTKPGQVVALAEQESLILSNLIDFGSPLPADSNPEYKGVVNENRIPSFWLQINKGASTQVDYFIDREDYLLRKMNLVRIGPDQNKEVILSITYDQYKKYGPVVLASVLVVKSQKLEREYVLDETIIGNGIPNKIFERPEQYP